MNKKITELVVKTTLAASDVFPVVDIVANTVKKISVTDLRKMISGSSVGDVRTSALTEAEFNAENWGTWKLMNGQSCVGSRLQTIKGWSNVPDAVTNGAFLRQAKDGRDLGSFEAEDFKSHTHTQNPHTHIQNAHTHVQDAHGHNYKSTNAAGSGTAGTYNYMGNQGGMATTTHTATAAITSTTATNQNTTATNQNTTAVNQNAGGAETRPNNIAVNFFIRVD